MPISSHMINDYLSWRHGFDIRDVISLLLTVHVVIDLSDVDLTKYILHRNILNVQTRFYPHAFF